MARRALTLPFVGVALAIYVGCGLSTMSGELVADPNGGGPTPTDDNRHSASDGSSNTSSGGGGGGVDEDAGPPPPTCQTDACALPAGGTDFGVVLYGDRSTACPTGFDPTDLIEKPTGTCACGQCGVTGVNCNPNTLTTKYDNDNGCSNTGGSISNNNGNCNVQGGGWSSWGSVVAPAAQGGSCTSQASTTDKGQYTTTPVRICTPQASVCSAELCTPPASLKACSIHNGDFPCPGGAPIKHVIATDFNPTCALCTCTVASKSCGGTLTVYSNSNCSGSTKQLPADQCVQMNSFNQGSSRWVASVNATCANSAAPTPSIAYVGAKTVCCPN